MRKTSEVRICAFPNCERQVKTAGYCGGHYQQNKAGKVLSPLRFQADVKKCSFESCVKTAVCKGLCDGHYQQLRAGQRLSPLQVIRDSCTVEGCSAPHEAKGYCVSHYGKWQEHGDPLGGRQPSAIEDWGTCLCVILGGEQGAGMGVLVSKEDRELVEGKSWWLSGTGYAEGKIDGAKVAMHRLILGLEAGDTQQGDHINGEQLDNRRENLRSVNFIEQMQNKKVWGKSGHRNVFWDERKKLWRVIVVGPDKRHSGGRHKRLEDALEAARLLRDKVLTHHVEDRC